MPIYSIFNNRHRECLECKISDARCKLNCWRAVLLSSSLSLSLFPGRRQFGSSSLKINSQIGSFREVMLVAYVTLLIPHPPFGQSLIMRAENGFVACIRVNGQTLIGLERTQLEEVQQGDPLPKNGDRVPGCEINRFRTFPSLSNVLNAFFSFFPAEPFPTPTGRETANDGCASSRVRRAGHWLALLGQLASAPATMRLNR